MRYLIALMLLLPLAAGDCEHEIEEVNTTRVFQTYLKNNLFTYLANPGESDVNFRELNATIKFYVTVTGDIDSSKICSESTQAKISTEYSGVNISQVVKKFVKRPKHNRVPRCSDGTPFGQCSDSQPMYCYSGKLEPMCAGPDNDDSTTEDNCGCAAGGGECNENTGLCGGAECINDTDCPDNVSYYCISDILMMQVDHYDCSAGSCVPDDSSSLQDSHCTNDYEPDRICHASAGQCVECTSDPYCPAEYTKRFCNGSVVTDMTCPMHCDPATWSCVYDEDNCNYFKYDNCSESPPYDLCVNKSGLIECGECNNDADCPTSSDIYCPTSQEVVNRTYPGNCSDGYCMTAPPVDYPLDTCGTYEECIHSCPHCVDKTLPNYEMRVYSQGDNPVGVAAAVDSDYVIYFRFNTSSQYDGTNHSYWFSSSTQLIEDNGTHHYSVMYTDGQCFKDCWWLWNMTRIPGTYNYTVRVVNVSGRRWNMPQDYFYGQEYFCNYGFNVTVSDS